MLPVSSKELETLFASDQVLAVDYETTGLQMHLDEHCAVGIGISNGVLGVYLDLVSMSGPDRAILYDFLNSRQLVFHNVVFDAGVYWKECGQYPQVAMCTSAMFKYLATEGWLGQQWSLKNAMVDILGWDEPNNIELKQWCKEHGRHMSQAPVKMLGKYCALDAIATAQLYEYFLGFQKQFTALFTYMTQEILPLARLTVAQQFNGILIDTDKLKLYIDKLQATIDTIRVDFLTHPDIQPHVKEYNQSVVEALSQNMPEKFTKSGKISKNWEKKKAKIAEYEQVNHFKITSKDHLIWLFYTKLGYTPSRYTDKGKPQVDKNVLPTLGEHGKMVNEYNKLLKEQQYCKACLDLCNMDVLHTMMKLPGTVTGRCSGGLE